ncbi:tetrapyrrole methylase [Cunninghamella echinulata]|nr:tetrapyrrole methylase [Cunninghamella echinulata]
MISTETNSTIPVPSVAVPQGGASLMVAFQCQSKKMLVIGSNFVAASRVLSLLEANAQVILIGQKETMVTELKYRIQQGQIQYGGSIWDGSDDFLATIQMAFLCEPIYYSHDDENKFISLEDMAYQCKQQRIPVNVTDRNDLCDFFMTSTYRDQSLQIAVSTNGQASKLANRIRRQIISDLPSSLGDAIQQVGILRKKIRQSDPSDIAKSRRMLWLAQICEYWSMDRLAKLSEKDMEDLLESYQYQDEGYNSGNNNSHMFVDEKGTITLVGSGVGDPKLLTLAAYDAIKEADLVLSDKIVPAEVVALVDCELKIARKFPGNADAAQQEFNDLALKALEQGKKVVRLKQGDPFLFGRGGEETIFFRKHGYVTKVIPGISSAVAAPLLAGIPLTHRSVSSQFLVTTGTGQKNSAVPLPTFESSRTDVILMAIHRLDALVADLLEKQNYPSDVPCAIIERASCSDQRVVYGTLSTISKVLQSVGGSRPPGLLVIGYAINVLKSNDLPLEGVSKNFYANDLQQTVNSNLLQLHDPEGVF